MSEHAHDLLREAQELLSHAPPATAIAEILEQALEQLVARLRKRRFAEGVRSRGVGRPNDPRHIPSHIRRQVAERDAHRCTFVSANGVRCGSRERLELDHVLPVARGGCATVDNLRMRCRAHNQHEAEIAFGRGFMEAKRNSRLRA